MLADQTGRIREDRARVALTGKFHFQLLSLMRPPLILTASIPMKRKWHGETTGVCHHWPLYGVVILLFRLAIDVQTGRFGQPEKLDALESEFNKRGLTIFSCVSGGRVFL